MTNHEKLQDLFVEVFLIDPSDFRLDLSREEVDTWDSLGVVSLAVGVQETFGRHFTQEEALGIKKVSDIVNLLESGGIPFHE